MSEKYRYVGAPLKPLGLEPLLRGYGKYIADITLPNTCYCYFVRSPYPHAIVKNIDKSSIMDRKGVITVITHEDLKQIASPLRIKLPLAGNRVLTYTYLADGKVRYVGEPVAAVIAEDGYSAVDAAEELVVEYEPLPPVVDAEKALEASSPLLYEEWGENVFARVSQSYGDVEKSFSEAYRVFRERIRVHRHAAMPIETRGCLSSYDPVTGVITHYTTTQGVFQVRESLAKALNMDEGLIRVISPRVGGSFGLKTGVTPEEIVVAVASIILKRPVKWVENRKEHVMAAGHAREQVHYIEVAVDRNGLILAVKDRIIGDMGASSLNYPHLGMMTYLITAGALLGPYKIRNYQYEIIFTVTNKCPIGSYRGFGVPEAAFVMERMMDIIAKELGLDPVDIRFRNLVSREDIPYVTAVGNVIDSGSYVESLNKALEEVGYWRLKDELRRLRKDGRYVGVGVSCFFKASAVGKWTSYEEGVGDNEELRPYGVYDATDSAEIIIDQLGRAKVRIGHSLIGTGIDMAVRQVVAEELGIPVENISVELADTLVSPQSSGSWASRGAPQCGASALITARKLREKILKIAAHLLEARQEDLEIREGYVCVKGLPERRVTIKTIAHIAYNEPFRLPEGMEPGLREYGSFTLRDLTPFPDELGRVRNTATFANSAHVAVVEVDAESGKVSIIDYVIVYDGGRVINPLIADGQVIGGALQGIGGALYEELVYDDVGNLVTSTLMDYLLPTALETPNFKLSRLETPSTTIPGGFKGVGELGTVPPMATIVNAVEDALSELGVKLLETPITPDKLWRVIRESREKERR